MRYLRNIVWTFLLFPAILWGQEECVPSNGIISHDTINRLADDFVHVSVVVCDPSEVLYSTLGHAALHLQCPTYDLDYIFTYEGENVRDKIWTFLKGDLKMAMYAYPPDLFVEIYRYSGRGVREYTMNLSPSQKLKLWEVMDRHVASGTDLPYDYFHRGCAKSVVRIIHEAIGPNAIHYAPWPDKYTKHTQREIVRNFITDAPWAEFVLYFLVGTEADKDCSCENKLIVPTDLVEVWQKATFDNGEPVLDSSSRVLLEATRYNQGSWCTPFLISIIFVVLALGSLLTLWMHEEWCRTIGLIIDYTFLLIFSMVGAFMTYLILFSDLPCTNWNWLIVPFNVLPLIIWHWRRYWALCWAIIIWGWCLVMIGELLWGHIIVDWPHILFALSFGIIFGKQYLSNRISIHRV